MSLIFRRRRHMARSRRHVCFPFVATNGGPSRQNTPFAGWATRGGRSPGSRVVAGARLPGNPSGNRERRLSAYSCGGSRGLDRESDLTAFPFFPDGGTTTPRTIDARRRASRTFSPSTGGHISEAFFVGAGGADGTGCPPAERPGRGPFIGPASLRLFGLCRTPP